MLYHLCPCDFLLWTAFVSIFRASEYVYQPSCGNRPSCGTHPSDEFYYVILPWVTLIVLVYPIVTFISRQRRDKIVVATKTRFPTTNDNPIRIGLSRRNIIDDCEASLRRLQTDYIDLYQVNKLT